MYDDVRLSERGGKTGTRNGRVSGVIKRTSVEFSLSNETTVTTIEIYILSITATNATSAIRKTYWKLER